MSLVAPNTELGPRELEKIEGELYSQLDANPRFSGMSKEQKDEIVNAELRRIEDRQSSLGRFTTSEFIKNPSLLTTSRIPVNMSMNLGFEPMKLQGDEYSNIEKALKESLYSIESNDFDIDENIVDMAAFRLVGRTYIAPGDERERLFEDNVNLCEAYADAWSKADFVYNSDKKYFGALAKKRERILNRAHLAKQSQPGIEVPVEVPEVPELPEEEKPSWFRRHPKWTAGIISLGLLGAYFGSPPIFEHFKKRQLVQQLKDSGAIPDEGKAWGFVDKYSSWAINNAYSNSLLNLARLWEKNQTIADSLGAYAKAPSYVNPDVSAWKLVNMTLDNPDIAVDTAREWADLARLLKSVKDIDKYPILLAGGAEQVDRIVYGDGHSYGGLAAGWNTEEAWEKYAIPAIDYIVELVNNGNFTVDGFSREEAGRLLLPIELTEIDIKTGRPIGVGFLSGGIKNVSPDKDLGGDSPQEWLGKLVYRIYNEKGARYRWAIREGNATYSPIDWHGWQLSLRAHQKMVKHLLENGEDLPIFIIGNAAIQSRFIGDPVEDRIEPLVSMPGQYIPCYSVLVGRALGRPVIVYDAKYLLSPDTAHDEPHVRTKSGDYLGLWADLDAYLTDCTTVGVQPTLRRRGADGQYVPVDFKR